MNKMLRTLSLTGLVSTPNSSTVADASLAEAFAPPQTLLEAQSLCSLILTPESRELLLEALRQADRLPRPGEKAQALIDLAWTYKRFEIPSARLLLIRAEFLGQSAPVPERIVLLQQLIEAYHCFDETETEAQRLIEMALPLVRTLGDRPSATDNAISGIAMTYAQAGEMDWAEAIAREIRDPEIRLTATRLLAEATESEFESDISLSVDHHPTAWNASLTWISPEEADTKGLIEQIEALDERLGQGETLTAAEISPLVQALTALPASMVQYLYGQELAVRLAQAQLFELAQQVIQSIPVPAEVEPLWGAAEQYSQPFALAKLAGRLALEGHLAQALQLVDTLPDTNANKRAEQAITRTAIANTLLIQNDLESAQICLAEAVQLAQDLPATLDQAWVLMSIATTYRLKGDQELGQEFIARAIALNPNLAVYGETFEAGAAMLQPTQSRPLEIDAIAEFWQAVDQGAVDRAAHLLDILDDADEQMDLLPVLAAIQEQAGQILQARDALQQALQLAQAERYQRSETFEQDSESAVFAEQITQIRYNFMSSGGSLSVLQWVLQHSLKDQADAGLRQQLWEEAIATHLYRVIYSEAATVEELQTLIPFLDQLSISTQQTELTLGLISAFTKQEDPATARQLTDRLSPSHQVKALAEMAQVYGRN